MNAVNIVNKFDRNERDASLNTNGMVSESTLYDLYNAI